MDAIAQTEFNSTDIQLRQEKSAFLRCMFLKYKCVIILVLAILNLAQYFGQIYQVYNQQQQQQLLSQDIIKEVVQILRQIYLQQQKQTNSSSTFH